MANDNNEARVGIKITADTSGAKQASNAIREVKEEVKAAAGDSDQLSSAMRRQVEASKLTAKATDEVTGAKRRLSGTMGRLAAQFPELGAAFQLLKSPLTGILTVIALVATEFLRLIKVQNELAQKFADLSARLDPLIVREVRNKQLQAETREAILQHNLALQAQIDLLDEHARKARESAEATERRFDADKKLLDAQKELALAQAGDDPKAQAAVHKEFAQKGEELARRQDAAKVVATHDDLENAKKLQFQARRDLPGARAKLEALRGSQGGAIDQSKTALEVAEEELKNATAGLTQAEQGKGIPRGLTAAQHLESARGRVVTAQANRDAAQAHAIDARAPITAAEAEVQRLERQDASATAAIPGLQAAYTGAAAAERSGRGSRAQVIAIESQTADTKAENEATKRAREEEKRERTEYHRAVLRYIEESTREHRLNKDKVEELIRRLGTGG
jgi:hypothetical protein